MLEGIPHSLLLSNSNDELSVLVPAWPPCRPSIDSVPFSTELVLDRSNKKWYTQLEHPYYMYPVHVSLSFLYSTTLASALYLLLLRYLNRQYNAVVRLVDTVGTDSALTKEEAEVLAFTTCSHVSVDKHPDASAARLKISLVMLDAPLKLPWDGELHSRLLTPSDPPPFTTSNASSHSLARDGRLPAALGARLRRLRARARGGARAAQEVHLRHGRQALHEGALHGARREHVQEPARGSARARRARARRPRQDTRHGARRGGGCSADLAGALVHDRAAQARRRGALKLGVQVAPHHAHGDARGP